MFIRYLAIVFLMSGEFTQSEAADFPSHMQIHVNNHNFLLEKTGEAKKEGVYSIAHYLQGATNAPERVILVQIFTDGDAKEFLIDWEKAMTSNEIQKEFRGTFNIALTRAEQEEHKEAIETFIHFFDQDIKPKEQMKIIWLSGGDLRVYYGAKQKGTMTNIPFAKALWKLWLGPKSVVNRGLLIDNFIFNDHYRD